MRHETFLRIKAAEDGAGERWITAWATTPSEDLAGDIVSPTGAEYELPVPLLAYHKHDQPVGAVTEAHVTEHGIRVRAKLTKGVRLADELWALIKDGAVAAVSIGFQALKSSPLASGGLLFERWRWLELSLTPTPCNVDARITAVGKMQAFGSTTPSPAEPAAPAAPAAPASMLNPILEEQHRALELGGNESDALAASIRAAAKLLPCGIADLVDIRRSCADVNGKTFRLTDALGNELATVTKGGAIKLAPGVLATGEPPTAKAAPQGLTSAQRAEVGEMLVELSQIISGTIRKEGLTPLRKRIEQLEKSHEH